MDKSFLIRKGQTWNVRVMVPVADRAALGRTRFVHSLGTRDLVEANRMKHAVIADIRQRIAAELARATLPPETADGILSAAQELRRAVERGEVDRVSAEAALDARVDGFLDAEGKRLGIDAATGHPELPEADHAAVKLAHRVFTGGDVTLLSDSIRDYLEEVAPAIRKQTLRTKERALDDLAAFVGKRREVATITRKLAGRYVAESINRRARSSSTKEAARSVKRPEWSLKTKQDAISHLVAYFNWLEARGEIEANPFARQSGTLKESTRGKAAKRRPWTNEELAKLLAGIPTSDPLWSLSTIAAYTGMRREEVSQLRVESTSAEVLTVTEGKTQAAVRDVPVHAALRPLIARLRAASSDGYLIPGLLTGGADDKRGHMIGKRFSKTIRTLGFKDTALTFHTLRNAFMHRCEEAGIPESTTKLLVGHQRQSLTYGTYSPGVSADSLRKAVAAVSYGKDADAFVRKAGAKVQLVNKSRRRHKRPARVP